MPGITDIPGVEVFVDKVHLSKAGNEIVANLVARWLVGEGFVADGKPARMRSAS